MEQRKTLIPEFGPLRGIRILGMGSLIAMPFAANLMAEFGAEFIEIERPGVGDVYRGFAPILHRNDKAISAAWMQEARNRLSFTLEMKRDDPDSLQVFLDLIRQCDVFIENMVWLEKFGIRDSLLLEVNPRLIIVHISGFGRPEFGGDPELCDRASYDIVGQAFSSYADLNGFEGGEPLLVKPTLNDYVTAMFAVFGMLTAYLEVQRSGQGQVIDVSQFESQAKIMRDAFTMNSVGVSDLHRSGNRSSGSQPWNLYESRDGRYVVLGAVGVAVFKRFMAATGLSMEEFPYLQAAAGSAAIHSPLGRRFDAAVADWCRAHDAEEIERILAEARVPCSRVNTPRECLTHPQFLDRGDFIQSEDQNLESVITAFGIVPKLSRTPGQIWRGAPRLGQDTEWILRELLCYGEDEIRRLREKGLI